jgi:hypothetical protein
MAFAQKTISSLRTPLCVQRRSVVARGVVDDVKQTLKPRVNELRRQQLSQGTTSVGSAFP